MRLMLRRVIVIAVCAMGAIIMSAAIANAGQPPIPPMPWLA